MLAKKKHTWRTLLVMHDLPREQRARQRTAASMPKLIELEQAYLQLELQIEDLELRHRRDSSDSEKSAQSDVADAERQPHALEQQRIALREEIRQLARAIDDEFHPLWGPLLREGRQEGSFAKQILDFADLYTSRATNLLHCSPTRAFRPPPRAMPHELAPVTL